MLGGDLMGGDAEIARILDSAYPSVGSADPASYISEVGNSVQALVYAGLYWPKLLEIEGAVFIAIWGDWEEYVSRRISTPAPEGWRPMSWPEMVDSFNVFEVGHIFRQGSISWKISAEADHELAQLLVRIWGARLAVAYPQRTFSVRFMPTDEVMESRIEVSQKYPPLAVPAGWNEERRAIIKQ